MVRVGFAPQSREEKNEGSGESKQEQRHPSSRQTLRGKEGAREEKKQRGSAEDC